MNFLQPCNIHKFYIFLLFLFNTYAGTSDKSIRLTLAGPPPLELHPPSLESAKTRSVLFESLPALLNIIGVGVGVGVYVGVGSGTGVGVRVGSGVEVAVGIAVANGTAVGVGVGGIYSGKIACSL